MGIEQDLKSRQLFAKADLETILMSFDQVTPLGKTS